MNHTYSAADLPLLTDGRIYHLGLCAEELSPRILLVGDPERAPLIVDAFFNTVEIDVSHRGLRTITGKVGPTECRISVVTSGMGTPSLEIVLQELVALAEIDLKTRKRKEERSVLNVIRVGTSGALRAQTPLGTPVIARYAVGLDNTGCFYDVPRADEAVERVERCVSKMLERVISPSARFTGKISPYVSKPNAMLCAALARAATRLSIRAIEGITVSCSGFFGNQGRMLAQVPLTVPDIDLHLSELDPGVDGLRFENMEMESSFLFHFFGAAGHRAAAICPAVGNRRTDLFDPDYQQSIENAAAVAIEVLAGIT